ncbi:hypothetical protein NDU88_006237 [Pleurodeles waltl]|uniref:Uncharacterized protein n=1 Tax=Pleurodeles waltl TaxID=8319 RepID=A0AAV7LBK2_PLEWA|nr:hypothetical protein NDU88_006237 [Pleurodeles waltl]
MQARGWTPPNAAVLPLAAKVSQVASTLEKPEQISAPVPTPALNLKQVHEAQTAQRANPPTVTRVGVTAETLKPKDVPELVGSMGNLNTTASQKAFTCRNVAVGPGKLGSIKTTNGTGSSEEHERPGGTAMPLHISGSCLVITANRIQLWSSAGSHKMCKWTALLVGAEWVRGRGAAAGYGGPRFGPDFL